MYSYTGIYSSVLFHGVDGALPIGASAFVIVGGICAYKCLLMLQEMAVYWEDIGVREFGWQCGLCGNRVQRVAEVVVRPVFRSLNCCVIAAICHRAVQWGFTRVGHRTQLSSWD